MKISTKGRYALRMLLDLAVYQGTGYVPLKDIAERQNISKKYLEQIVPILNKTDILNTNRGYQGGYRLARTPDKYTVSEISAEPSRVDGTMSEYAIHLGGLTAGEWVYAVKVSGDLADGVHKAEIVIESISPISFILN